MKRNHHIALCAAVAFAAAGDVPEWVHLLPAGEIRTVDGRGPYKVASMTAIADAAVRIPIDECHVTDKGAATGTPAPARGWIVEMQAREDGLWGRVEWTPTGQQLMAEKAYAGISPVILHTLDGSILGVLRASLTNTPNLQGLTSLHSEDYGMDWKAKLIELLGLDSGADDAAITAALTARLSGAEGEKALCAQDLLTHPTVVALQGQLTDVTNTLNTINAQRGRDAAIAFVDAAIAAGRVGVKPAREEYIAMHMATPAQAEALISKLPALSGISATAGDPTGQSDGERRFDAADRTVMSLFGVDEEEYAKGLAAGGVRKGIV